MRSTGRTIEGLGAVEVDRLERIFEFLARDAAAVVAIELVCERAGISKYCGIDCFSRLRKKKTKKRKQAAGDKQCRKRAGAPQAGAAQAAST